MEFRNISITLNNFTNFKNLLKLLKTYKSCLEILEINNLKFRNFKECQEFFFGLENLKSLKLNKCQVENLNSEKLSPIRTLNNISFQKCSNNIFKIFTNQDSFEKITVINNDWTWNGFPHDVFNEICRNCINLVLIGPGTGSYFDSDEFPFKITKLETSMITFHWYVGIMSARVNFLESQKGSLKDLTIHQLPYDFDGGKVLKYIIEEMNLDKFYYGKIPLIVNGKKQEFKEFEVSEIQITSAYEMIRQFPSIEKLTLKLSNTDICSDAIEKIINPPTNLFNNLKELEVIDNSTYRGIFGVFLGLYKNLHNLEKLTFKTQDRNINTILECLPIMQNLHEIQLTSTAPRASERYETILKIAPNLKKIFISCQSANEAHQAFESNHFEIFDIETSRCLKDVTSKCLASPTRGRYCQLINQEPTKQASNKSIVTKKENF